MQFMILTCTDPNEDDGEEDFSLRDDVQVIGMSATMPNVAQVRCLCSLSKKKHLTFFALVYKL